MVGLQERELHGCELTDIEVEEYIPKGFFNSFDWNDDFSLLGSAFFALWRLRDSSSLVSVNGDPGNPN